MSQCLQLDDLLERRFEGIGEEHALGDQRGQRRLNMA